MPSQHHRRDRNQAARRGLPHCVWRWASLRARPFLWSGPSSCITTSSATRQLDRRWRMTRLASLVALALFFVLPTHAMGQARVTGADLEGTIVDQSTAVLPGAIVTVINVETNVARTVTSDSSGHYYVPALPPGTYTI